MNSEDAAPLIPLHRPGREAGGRLLKAIRFAEKDPQLSGVLASQAEFDTKIVGVIQSIQSPENLRRKLREAGERSDVPKRGKWSHVFNPAVLTALLGVLLIAGFGVWQVMERMEKFPGREAVEQMINTTDKMSGVELDSITGQTGTMGDWFYMRGFEGFMLPTDLAKMPVVGSRVFRQEGHPIAQMVVESHQHCILLVFHASEFGVDVGNDEPWRLLTFQGGKVKWVAALRCKDDVCSMLAFPGERPDMKDFLAKLKAQ